MAASARKSGTPLSTKGRSAMSTSPMPNSRDYPDPIGYAVASADWWRARVDVVNIRRQVFSAPTTQKLAFAVAGAICGLAVVGLTLHKLSVERVVRTVEDGSDKRDSRLAAA
jgi:hypothetical protein